MYLALDVFAITFLITEYQPAGRPLPDFVVAKRALKARKQKRPVEESPGSLMTRWRLTAAGGDPRESATENIPPALSYALRRGNPQGCVRSGKGEKVR